MTALQITDLKKFTSLLFTDDTFDKFLLHDACFVTAHTVNIEGKKNPEFFTEEERENELKEPYMRWADLRPFCMKLITGHRLPLGFKIVLLTAPENTEMMKKNAGFQDCDVTSMSINISYQNNALTLTTGISYAGFTMDKSLDKYWDQSIIRFLNRKDLNFEEL